MTRIATVTTVLTLVASGCGGSLDHYETENGAPTRLNGAKVTTASLTVGEATRLQSDGVVQVRGYLLAPHDDVHRLCTRIEADSASCRGAASLALDTSNVDLGAYRDSGGVLEAGCCSIGYWSPRELSFACGSRTRDEPSSSGSAQRTG